MALPESATTAQEGLFFIAEVDIHLNPKIGPDWMLPGTQRLVMTPGKNEKRDLAGAYDPFRLTAVVAYAA